MISGGNSCQVNLEAAGGEMQPMGTWTFREDIIEGSILRCRIAVENAPTLAPGELLTLKIQDVPGSRNESSVINLWISKVSRERGLEGDALFIEAVDPLSLCRGLPQFHSYVGNVSLDVVVGHIMSGHCAFLTEKPRLDSGFPQLPQKWLLQAEEGGAEFLHRLASDLGTVLYWDRDRLRCSVKGNAPAEASLIEPMAEKEIYSSTTVKCLPLTTSRLWWTDPIERRTKSVQVNGSSGGAGEIHQRIVSLNPPTAAQAPSSHLDLDRGTIFSLTGPLVRARLGDLIQAENGDEFCIEEAVHEFESAGSCKSNLVAVPAAQWGSNSRPNRPGLIGPFQAIVTHNHDPDGCGRIRVRLSEDPEARPTPFIPVLAATSGHEMGSLFIPEIGDSVLVVADGRCPEDLYCLGAVRAGDKPLPGFCHEDGNSIKMLMARNGVGLVIDDTKMSIKLVTPESSIELGPDGMITINGKTYLQQMSDESTIESSRRIKLDGNRIELG